jgi:hypothetical protein
MEKTMAEATQKKVASKKQEPRKTQFAHIEVEVELSSQMATNFARRSIGFVMGALTNFYKLQSEKRNNKQQVLLDKWLEEQIDLSFDEMAKLKKKVQTTANKLSKGALPKLTYPTTVKQPIVCSHPASYSVIEILGKLDEIGKIADSLYLTRKINRSQLEQIGQESKRVITKFVDTVNKFNSNARGRTKEETTQGASPQVATESKAPVQDKPEPKSTNRKATVKKATPKSTKKPKSTKVPEVKVDAEVEGAVA